MDNLKIIQSVSLQEYGFFFVEFDNGLSVQCCLKANKRIGGEFCGYANQIEGDNSGFNEGISFDCNAWAIIKYGEDAVLDFLVDAARKKGIEIVA
jgi:hypothetical protein